MFFLNVALLKILVFVWMSKLKFQVVYASGEDPEYPSEQLNVHSPHTIGWASPRFCEYPQELGFELSAPSQLSRIQILSHQYKIATKVELFVGNGPTYEKAKFERLGYLSLNNNQRSNYQARELKSVYINSFSRFVKFVIHRCYINKYNLFNQVGIIAVNLIGMPGEMGTTDKIGDGLARVNIDSNSNTNKGSILSTMSGNTAMEDISFDMNFDPETAARIREIHSAKELAVQEEDYDTAKRLKEAEKELKSMGGNIAKLEVAKRQAVSVEDYDRAKSLKGEISVMRREVERRLQPYLQGSILDKSSGSTNFRAGNYNGENSGESYQYDRKYGDFEYPQDNRVPLRDNSNINIGANHFSNHNTRQNVTLQVENIDTNNEQNYENESHENIDHRKDTFSRGHQKHNTAHDLGLPDDALPTTISKMKAAQDHAEALDKKRPKSREIRSIRSYTDAVEMGLQNGDGKDQIQSKQYEDEVDDPHVEEDENSIEETDPWGDGPHPLEGVPNYDSLPIPEALNENSLSSINILGWNANSSSTNLSNRNEDANNDESKLGTISYDSNNPLLLLLGEYLTRCLFSKTWTLRAAVLCKLKLSIPTLGSSDFGNGISLENHLPAIAGVIKFGAEDKIAHVFTESISLMECFLSECEKEGLRKPAVGPNMEGLISLLIIKLGDGQAKIRDTALTALTCLARSPCVGSHSVSSHSLRKFNKKQAAAWRPIQSRLLLLKVLVNEFGISGSSGLITESIMGWVKDHNAFSHQNAEVRDAAKELTVAIYENVGATAMKYLGTLRPKQLDEYKEAFRRTKSKVSGDIDAGYLGSPSSNTEIPKSARSSKSVTSKNNSPTKKLSPNKSKKTPANTTPHSKSPKVKNDENIEFYEDLPSDEELDESVAQLTCQFCGRYDKDFTEDTLDLHYFQDCPLLMRCDECGQVIEIICLTEHLLTECDAKDQYEECPTSHMAVKKSFMGTWKTSKSCRPCLPSEDTERCPLCFVDVKPNTNNAIRAHYTKRCPKNPRRIQKSARGIN